MASLEESASSTVSDGTAPDSIVCEPRRWQFSVLRERNPAPPDFSNAGWSVNVHGDPLADADPVSALVLPGDNIRNGLKRSYASNGAPTLWAEPAPQTYDTAGSVAGNTGVFTGPAGAVDNVIALGGPATHSLAHPGTADFPLLVRPVATVFGTRFESAQATLQAGITTDLASTVSNFVRDLSYGYGGLYTLVWPALTLLAGQTYSFTVQLQLLYRQAITEAFEVQSAGSQVLFQVIEQPSAGS